MSPPRPSLPRFTNRRTAPAAVVPSEPTAVARPAPAPVQTKRHKPPRPPGTDGWIESETGRLSPPPPAHDYPRWNGFAAAMERGRRDRLLNPPAPKPPAPPPRPQGIPLQPGEIVRKTRYGHRYVERGGKSYPLRNGNVPDAEPHIFEVMEHYPNENGEPDGVGSGCRFVRYAPPPEPWRDPSLPSRPRPPAPPPLRGRE